ncbi:MAG: hypothetical protein HOQ45_20280 [Nocardioidaceae bacterium]|nr:hypothetical protein [Nocardioidaceae bacterium]
MVDDIRVFHQVPDPLSLPSSRFFSMAERLHMRGGAVAHTFAAVLARPDDGSPRPALAGPPVAPAAAPLPDIADMVGVSGPNSRGEPWIEYRGA